METKLFKTRNYYEAVTLFACQQKLLRLEPLDQKSVLFVFDDTLQSCDELVNKHINGKLKVSSKSYVDAIRTLKDMVFGNRNIKQGF
ncbi:MAG: hypothetical protein A2252_06240 [Elusimicrobia bacterium RIFOXYA2_FULL_39_19]|nr:MAG: hypothetical protein A2252_06240 [Elusimicrobia bacterium RIFOXYA2_FULL_39_19]